ncbi:MAG: LLM class flavin-dependent oxidoreductase [Chloroflexota bacterium]
MSSGQLHVGLVVPNYGSALSAEGLRASVIAAEEAGFDSAWTTDHIAVPADTAPIYGEISEALVTLGFLAGVTRSIRLGVSSLIIPQRQPLLALKQVLSLEVLAPGRTILCVAPGWTEAEFTNMGSSLAGRGRRLDAWLDMLDRALSTPPGPFQFHQEGMPPIDDAWIAPKPQRPETWIAGNSDYAVRRAARYDAWHPVGRTVDDVTRGVEVLRQLTAETRVILRLAVRSQERPDPSGRDERGRAAVSGPADWIAERLTEYARAGCDGFVVDLGVAEPGLPDRIGQFAADVMPYLNGTGEWAAR